jgi:hypothetical protein
MGAAVKEGVMRPEFDPVYRGRYRRLVLNYPDESVYPADSFRVEWGRIFVVVALMGRRVCW